MRIFTHAKFRKRLEEMEKVVAVKYKYKWQTAEINKWWEKPEIKETLRKCEEELFGAR